MAEVTRRYRDEQKPQEPPDNQTPGLHAELTPIPSQVEQLRANTTKTVPDDRHAEN